MKVELLRDDSHKQESLISESVVAIWTNLHIAREQHDTCTVMKTPRVVTVRDNDQRDDPGLPHPSACLPRDVSTGIHGWLVHYPNVHPGGMVG
jgi:hypothetical protein